MGQHDVAHPLCDLKIVAHAHLFSAGEGRASSAADEARVWVAFARRLSMPPAADGALRMWRRTCAARNEPRSLSRASHRVDSAKGTGELARPMAGAAAPIASGVFWHTRSTLMHSSRFLRGLARLLPVALALLFSGASCPTDPGTDSAGTGGTASNDNRVSRDNDDNTSDDTGSGGSDSGGADDSNGDSTGGSGDDAGGSNDNADDGGDASGDTNDNAAGDSDSDDTTEAGFTTAAVIHQGAAGFLADATINLPAEANYNVDGSIHTAVRLARVSKDGARVWFTTQDYNGFLEPQIFCINADGTGLQEFAVPAGFHTTASELAVSGTGDSCVLLHDVDADGYKTGYISTASVLTLVDRASGQQFTIFDGRSLQEFNDFLDVHLTDDGETVFFRENESGIIYSIGVSGGTPTVIATPADWVRSGSTALGPVRFRVVGDGTALAAIIRFDAGGGYYPTDLYVRNSSGFSGLTATGDIDWYNTANGNDLGISDDGLLVAYGRYDSDNSIHRTYVRNVGGGDPVEISVIDNLQRSFGTLLDPGRSVVLTGWGMLGDSAEITSLFTPDGTSRLEYRDGWIQNWVAFTSMSHGGGILVGTWANGGFGDPARLYAWRPGAAQFRSGPIIDHVEYRHDLATDTLEVRATVVGTPTAVRFFGFKFDIESFYTAARAAGDATDPFFDERFGADMAPVSDSPGVFTITVDLEGVPLTSDYRVRIGASDDNSRDCAYVDFRPVPPGQEALDLNGDGQPG